MMSAYAESEGYQIMADAIIRGAAETISADIAKKGRTGFIETFNLQDTLKVKGMIPDLDTGRITSLLQSDHKVEVTRFH